MLVKICGITNLHDAQTAIEAGAQALGFNFWPSSRRYIDPKAARLIIDELPDEILTVGVFVNGGSPSLVAQIASGAGVQAIQLHGDESSAFCDALAGWYVIKVLAVDRDFNPASALDYRVSAIMLDAADQRARGGTGRTIDWSLARQTRELVPRLFLAGGLAPENVLEAINAVHPYAVDACSALEISAGQKDPNRVRAFINAARQQGSNSV